MMEICLNISLLAPNIYRDNKFSDLTLEINK